MPIRWIYTLPFFLLVACGPLVPLHHPKEALDNPPIVFESDDFTISLQYLRRKYGHYVFDLLIENKTDTAIFINPSLISLYASRKMFPYPIGNEDIHQLSLLNSTIIPPRVLGRNEQEVRHLAQDAANAKVAIGVLFAVITVGAAIYDAEKDAEDANKEQFTREDESRAIARDAVVLAGRLSTELVSNAFNNAVADQQYLPYELMPTGELNSHETRRGQIYIPNPASYRYTRIIIPIDGIDYVFDFRLKMTKEKSPYKSN